jgi:hypothetical protein
LTAGSIVSIQENEIGGRLLARKIALSFLAPRFWHDCVNSGSAGDFCAATVGVPHLFAAAKRKARHHPC